MRNDPKTPRYCRNCGTPIDPELLGHNAGLCHQCKVNLAEEYVPEKTDQDLFRRIPKSRVFRIGLWAVILICAGITLVRIPVLRKALRDPKPIRVGTYETDAPTDACIQNLWQAAKILQEQQVPGSGLVCPVSGKPYKVEKDEDITIVLCPNPEKHHLRSLRLSNASMVPEVIR